MKVNVQKNLLRRKSRAPRTPFYSYNYFDEADRCWRSIGYSRYKFIASIYARLLSAKPDQYVVAKQIKAIFPSFFANVSTIAQIAIYENGRKRVVK